MDIQENFNLWHSNLKNKSLLLELESLSEEQKNTAFFKDIEFGTAGMRGIVGVGSNSMNICTVGRVSEAVAIFMKETQKKSIAISYDSRNKSLEFAKLSAQIFAYHGIKVYLANTLMPTPYLSFMVRHYKCDMGVMITASHNPKEYNGYKVYGSDGCQLLEEPSNEITKIALTLSLFGHKKMSFKKAVEEKLIVLSDEKTLNSYFKAVTKQSVCNIKNIKVVYSALNGTGINTVPQVLQKLGAEVVLNRVQCKPDKNFSTCPYPNPEKFEVFPTSIEIAKKVKADLIVASDPDADRVGVCVFDDNNEYVHLTGNEIGVLLTDFLFSHRKENGGILVKSIVSSVLAQKVAESYGATTKNVLTGFKYIGEFVTNLEKQGKEEDFVLGFEESSGYLAGTYVRDKDATVASMLIAEMASELKKQGKTLISKLNEIYEKYGYFESIVLQYRFEGASGNQKMKDILADLRKTPPKVFGKFKTQKVTDYLSGVDDLPKADVLMFLLDEDIQVIVRPSGTEPLIKCYLTFGKTKEQNKLDYQEVKKSLDLIFNK